MASHAMDDIPIASPKVDDLLGVLMICGIVAAYAFGVTCSQAYIYFDKFTRDPWPLKSLVAVVWLLDTLHMVLLSHTIYHYTVTNFGNYDALQSKTTFSFNLEVIVVPMLALVVQCYFAYRVYSMDKKNRILSGVICIFALAQLGFGFACAVTSFVHLKGFPDLPNYRFILISWLAFGAAADTLVSGSLIWTFYRNKTTFTDDDGIVTKLLMYLVHTGALTSIVTVVDLIFVITMPGTLVFSGLNYVLGKLYTNTFLYALNRRPATDSAWATSSVSKASLSHPNLVTNTIITHTKPHVNTFTTAPRIQVRDPYAPGGEDYDNDGEGSDGKAGSLTDVHERGNVLHSGQGIDHGDLDGGDGRKPVVLRGEEASEVSFITMEDDDRKRARF